MNIPPNDIISEHAVLSCLMIDSAAMEEICGRLKKEDFYNPKNALIYETIEKLYRASEAYDLIMLAAALRSAGNLDKVVKPTLWRYRASLTEKSNE
jgi:replicative DNA helicase